MNGRAKNKDDAVSLSNDSIDIERPGTVEFEFGTLQAQSRAGLLPSTWLLLFLTQLSKSPPDFTSRHLGDLNLKKATLS